MTRRIACLLLSCLAFVGCGQGGSTPMQRSDLRHPEPPPGPDGRAVVDMRSRAPVTYVALGPRVFLDSIREPDDALAILVGQAFLEAGQFVGGAGIEAPLGLQPVAWLPTGQRPARRLALPGFVVLRTGFIEHFLSHGGKAHESIIMSEVDGRFIHFGLLALGATPGKPVQYRNAGGTEEFRPPTGDKIRVLVQYQDPIAGTNVVVPAQSWIRESKSKKPLTHDWVFAGSFFYDDPDGKPQYAANEGRLICVTNFNNALLDLPIRSVNASPEAYLDFEVNDSAVPPRLTPVTVFLETMDQPK